MKKIQIAALLLAAGVCMTGAGCGKTSVNSFTPGNTGRSQAGRKAESAGRNGNNVSEKTEDISSEDSELSENHSENNGTIGEAEETAKVEIKENNYKVDLRSDGNWDADAYLVMKNESSQYAYTDLLLTITAYDKDGDPVGTNDEELWTMEPGEEQAVISGCECIGKPERVEFEISEQTPIDADPSLAVSSDFSVRKLKSRTDSSGDIYITGILQNNSHNNVDRVRVTTFFKRNGKIVYGMNEYVDDIKAGKFKTFDYMEFGDKMPKYDSYSVFAMSTGDEEPAEDVDSTEGGSAGSDEFSGESEQ